MRGVRRGRAVAGALAAASAALLLGALPAAAEAGAPDGADQVEVPVVVEIPGDRTFQVTDAELVWGLNLESGGGAFYGGCNFLSAGAAGDAGSSRLWTAADGFYRTQVDEVTVEKPASGGGYAQPTWATKCQNVRGVAVTSSSTSSDNFTGNRVRIDGGVGSVDQRTGTATIRWSGSFTVAYYGGLTYWTATDPVLEVSGGVGTLTATVSGYGADMTDTSRWVRLAPRTVRLAVLHGAGLGDRGFTVTPDYLGVSVDTGTSTPQPERDGTNAAYWGSFPQDFVDFQQDTGQSSYWYTSGGSRDAAKPATALTVSYDATDPVPDDESADAGGTAGSAASPVNSVVQRPTTAAAAPVGSAVLAAEPEESSAPAASPTPEATGPATVLASRALIPSAGGGAVAPTAGQVAALGGLVGLVLAAGGALGLVKGWLVVPWRH